MADASVERVLLGRLDAAGLTRGQTMRLARSTLWGSPTARRILERAAVTRIGTEGRCVHGLVEIAPNIGWRDGTLFDPLGTIPRTVALALVGRPIGDVIRHPDIDHTLVADVPRDDNGILSVPPEYVRLRPMPNPISWLRHVVALTLRRNVEKPISWRMRAAFAFPALISGSVLMHRIGRGTPHTALSDIGTATMAFSCLIMILLVVDALTGRAISETVMRSHSTYEIHVETLHAAWLEERYRERGFDDEGVRRV